VRYPDCEYSLPLPRRGDIEVVEAYCAEHDLPELVVHDGDDEPWELGCPICNYREYRREQDDDTKEDTEDVESEESSASSGEENTENDDATGESITQK
jgi:DNA topoisomerase-1